MIRKIAFILIVYTVTVSSDELTDLINSVFTPAPSVNPVEGPENPTNLPPFTPGGLDGNTLPPGVPENDNCVNGECVPYYLCTEDGKINTDGSGIFDVRFDEGAPLECHDYMKVCCKSDEIRETREPHEVKPVGCGNHNPTGLGINIRLKDTDAFLAEFPWMVALLQKENINGKEMSVYQCGGSLIHPQVVLTAAHCVEKIGSANFIARAGEWDTQTNSEIFEHQDRIAEQVKIHPDYKKGSLQNDIALVYLAQLFNLAENVQTICLPPQNYNFDANRCYAAGWGKDVFGKQGRYSVIMKKVKLPVVEHGQCQAALRGTRLSKRFNLHESFMCAGGEMGVDTCSGDGGSPLACPIPGAENRFYQAGIVAWGVGCGENQVPGVYVNVAKFRNWIDEIFIANNIDTKPYTQYS